MSIIAQVPPPPPGFAPPGPTAPTAPQPTAVCGNGDLETGEQCDDGNTNSNDACTNACIINVCGDGFLNTGVEQCDDGNTRSGDGCVNCRVEEVTAIQSCTAAGGSCKTNACSNYNSCSPVLGSCSTGVCCSGSCTERVAPTPTPSPVPTGRTVVPQSIVESILSGVEICNELYRCGESDRICPDHFFPVEFRCFTYDFDCNFPRSCVEIDGTCTRECSGRTDPDCMRVAAESTTVAATDIYSIARSGAGIPIPSGSILLPDGTILLPDRRILFRSGTVLPLDPREPLPTGGIPIPEGSILLPDGRILLTNGNIILLNGNLQLLDGTIIPLSAGTLLPNGNLQLPNGNIILPNGNLQLLDGTIIPLSAGTLLPNGNLQFPDGTIIPIVEAPSLGISAPGIGGPPGIGTGPPGMDISNCVENIGITSSCRCGDSVVSSGFCCNSRHQILSCSECLYSGVETCDGVNNDCDSSIDEGNICGSGEVCISGSCQPRAACNPTNDGVECCGDNIDNDCRNGIDNICDRDNDGYVDCDAPICAGVTGITCREFEREEERGRVAETLCVELCRSERLCNIMRRVRIC